MATEPDEERPFDTDEGGPVKSFLDHLEDLRWVLIKSGVTLFIAMLICLIAGDKVVQFLKYPLEKAQVRYGNDEPRAVVMFGTNRLGTYTLNLDQYDVITGATNGNPSMFSVSNIVDFKAFATRLKDPAKSDLVSRFLTNELSPESAHWLTNYPTGMTATWQRAMAFFGQMPKGNSPQEIEDKLREPLLADLNRVIQTKPIYDSNRFAEINLSPDTVNLLSQKTQGKELERLNRKLLLQAYPGELQRRFLVVQVEPKNDGTNLSVGLWINSSTEAEARAKKMKVDLSTLSPAGGFYVAFQVAIYAGIGLSSPFIFYFVAQFVFPALKWNEKKYIYRGLGFSVPLFLLGASFCYFVLMPVALSASQIYSNWLGFSADLWRAEDYISFVSKFILGMGLGFEMPVVILVLVKLGILNYRILSKGRRYMIVINLVLGALLTTPEVLTQILMAIPLQLLYEISVWIAWYWEWKEKRREAREGNALSDD